MSFGALKEHFVKTFWFEEKRTPKIYTVDFVETKQVTFAQSFFSLLASVIDLQIFTK